MAAIIRPSTPEMVAILKNIEHKRAELEYLQREYDTKSATRLSIDEKTARYANSHLDLEDLKKHIDATEARLFEKRIEYYERSVLVNAKVAAITKICSDRFNKECMERLEEEVKDGAH